MEEILADVILSVNGQDQNYDTAYITLHGGLSEVRSGANVLLNYPVFLRGNGSVCVILVLISGMFLWKLIGSSFVGISRC